MEAECLEVQGCWSGASLVINRAIARRENVAVSTVNKRKKQAQLWCQQQVLLLLSGDASERDWDWAPKEVA